MARNSIWFSAPGAVQQTPNNEWLHDNIFAETLTTGLYIMYLSYKSVYIKHEYGETDLNEMAYFTSTFACNAATFIILSLDIGIRLCNRIGLLENCHSRECQNLGYVKWEY